MLKCDWNIQRVCFVQVVFTDHSLFGFADIASIITNKVLKVSRARAWPTKIPAYPLFDTSLRFNTLIQIMREGKRLGLLCSS